MNRLTTTFLTSFLWPPLDSHSNPLIKGVLSNGILYSCFLLSISWQLIIMIWSDLTLNEFLSPRDYIHSHPPINVTLAVGFKFGFRLSTDFAAKIAFCTAKFRDRQIGKSRKSRWRKWLTQVDWLNGVYWRISRVKSHSQFEKNPVCLPRKWIHPDS